MVGRGRQVPGSIPQGRKRNMGAPWWALRPRDEQNRYTTRYVFHIVLRFNEAADVAASLSSMREALLSAPSLSRSFPEIIDPKVSRA